MGNDELQTTLDGPRPQQTDWQSVPIPPALHVQYSVVCGVVLRSIDPRERGAVPLPLEMADVRLESSS